MPHTAPHTAIDCLATDPQAPRDVYALRPADLQGDLQTRVPVPGAASWVAANGFTGLEPGKVLLLPDGAGGVAAALLALGAGSGPFAYGALPFALPEGDWGLVLPEGEDPADAALGFCLGAYRYRRFVTSPRPAARLVTTPGMARGIALADAVWLARDLINTPANLLGPAELAEAACEAGARFGAAVAVTAGAALEAAYPAIAAVGRGSDRPPQVATLRWQGSRADAGAPLVSLVGKGVCFDTGGYDLKPSSAMLRMKKDMGGAAIMLGLAAAVMQADLPVRLELRLGCVENSVSGRAMRPSDVLATRKGLSVEVGNTDAEGRLVLCDLLAEACELSPAVLLDAATLTGAARVALGPDLPALFSNDDALAAALCDSGAARHDPLWRLPLWDGYDDWLKSGVADLGNVSSKPMAGAVTAALFLRRFVAPGVAWAHLDTYAWNDGARTGRPEGGEAQGLRASFDGLLRFLNLPFKTEPQE